ncbi:hypothetical protein [Kangiella shandongensis]|uniref:hypothetical protein n=1 Tax=Kangiella shandongensis TaxID=2763258 RepID=UPI001CBDCBA0|nr:hypothetical protein [Kangiella shandongensis]
MERLKETNQSLGQKIDLIVKLFFLAWAFGILGWCLARSLDKSEWLIAHSHVLEEHLELYVLIMFQVVPVTFAILGAFALRKSTPARAALFFIASVGLFIWLG